MYTAHRLIHLVPMKYREWAGHSTSLTSLHSTIRLSAIMASPPLSGTNLGLRLKATAAHSPASLQTFWNILNLWIQREAPTCLFDLETVFL